MKRSRKTPTRFAVCIKSKGYEASLERGKLYRVVPDPEAEGRSYGMPWLAGMVALFAFEFVEGNTITRLYFRRLRRLTRAALERGAPTPDLEQARREHLPTFTHFLDLPILFVIVALGAMRPGTWTLFLTGVALAVGAAAGLTLALPRLYPFEVRPGRGG
jgi:hypothetical protein